MVSEHLYTRASSDMDPCHWSLCIGASCDASPWLCGLLPLVTRSLPPSLPPAGAGGAAVVGGGLADSPAPRRPAPGQGQQRGLHPRAPTGTLPQGRQEALRQGRQEVTTTALFGLPSC